MSKTHNNLRRSFMCFVALLQLAVVPATFCLHIDCGHTHGDGHHNGGILRSVVSCLSQHQCACSHHSTDDSSHGKSPSPEEPHDSHSCRICQAAFATCTADFCPPQLTETGVVSVLTSIESASPSTAPRYRSKSRGPPSKIAA